MGLHRALEGKAGRLAAETTQCDSAQLPSSATKDHASQTGRAAGGECASRIIAELHRRPVLHSHVITFANEKGGVGKSTLAFQTAIDLARKGADVLAIDLDARQRSLARALENREATIRSLDIELPCPRYAVLHEQSGGMLCQEIQRLGADADFVIIDVHGHDSPLARRAIAMADTLITPVNASFLDLDSIARFSPATLAYRQTGSFGATVLALQAERMRVNGTKADWIMVKNRLRYSEKRQQARIDDALEQLSTALDVRVASGVAERVAFRELFLFGLTHPDLADVPQLSHLIARDTHELSQLFEEMALPTVNGGDHGRKSARVSARVRGRDAYIASLRAHACKERPEESIAEPAE